VRCPRLEVVARAGVGLDNIDVAAADECGIVVIGAQGANARSVAELAVALALGLARDLVGHDRRVRAGGWDRRPGVELAGRTWGVVGLGSTGAATAGLASALGMMVIGCDAYLPRGEEPDCVERVAELGTLLARSDVVSLHLPHTAETAGIVDADFLARMRTGSFLVNVGRGGLIDEDALLDALDHGPLAGAALDVRASEPPTPGRLEGHERVVLTPHVAGLTYEAQERVVSALADDLRRALGGEEVEGGVGVCRRVGRRDGA
jgi:D-3-phosphoglycerate dehydrogenase/(S)-sulfolactate dehydrogenase